MAVAPRSKDVIEAFPYKKMIHAENAGSAEMKLKNSCCFHSISE